MGSSKKVTVSYWYKLIMHLGWCKGPIDALLEIRGGDRTAWSGELTSSGTISINAPNLFGGEKDQGGIVGDVDVLGADEDGIAAFLASRVEERALKQYVEVLAGRATIEGADLAAAASPLVQ